MTTSVQTQIETKSRVNIGTAIDVIVIVGFALFALAFSVARVHRTYPFSQLQGDAANIASWAAAWEYPDLFEGDPVLSNPDNFRVYATVHIPLLRLLERATGDFGWPFVYLIGPHVFVQAVGFYILGRVLFQQRYWAVLLSVVTLMFVPINLGEYWGILDDTQPRFTFQALLPYLLASAITWRAKPSAWPWLMLAVGLLMYVHPVSTPAWAFAIWIGLWAFHPKTWSLRTRFGAMLFLGIGFVAVILPFMTNYLQSFAHGTTIDYDRVYHILENAFQAAYLDIPLALQEYISLPEVVILLPLSIFGAIAVFKLCPEKRGFLRLIGLWLAGLLFVTVAVPIVDQAIARANDQIPLQYDFIRGIRYLIPMMLLFCVWPLAELQPSLQGPRRKLSIAVIGLLLASLWVYWHQPDLPALRQALSCIRRAKIVCVDPVTQPTIFDIVSEYTPPGSRIMVEFSTDYQMLAIRYDSLRPLVFHSKDRGILAYSNHEGLLRWNDINMQMTAILAERDIPTRLENLLDLARDLDAQYLVVQSVRDISPEFFTTMGVEVIYPGENVYLIRL